MFKKHALVTVATIFVLMAAVPVHVWAQQDSQYFTTQSKTKLESREVLVMIDKIIALNPRITNTDLIYPGDTVFVPASSTDSTTKMYIAESWLSEGGKLSRQGCLWKIAETHLRGNLNVKPIAVAPSLVDTVVQPTTSIRWEIPRSMWWLLGIIIVLLLGLLVHSSQKRAEEQSRKTLREQERLGREMDEANPNLGTPMIAGGLSENPQVAIAQIKSAGDRFFYNPDRVIKEVVRGRICGPIESQFFMASVWYREGVRKVRIPSGTSCYRVTVGSKSDPDSEQTEFWMRHCGNLFAEVASGRFELPAGWEFIPDTEGGTVVQATQSQPNEVAVAAEDSDTDEGADADHLKKKSLSLELTIALDKEKNKLHITGNAKYPKSVKVGKDGDYEISFS